MKGTLRPLFSGLLLLASLAAYAQSPLVSVKFRERFDAPSGPDSVTTFHTTPSTTVPYWNDTTALFVSPGKSYHAKVVPFDSIIFETNTFSTLGNVFVRMTFDQICKVHYGQQAYIMVSNNNGATWTRLGAPHYQGPSSNFNATSPYFNEISYPNPSAANYWGGLTLTGAGTAPLPSWWVQETFNLSSLLGGGPAGTGNGFAQCKIRFILEYRTPQGQADPAGWFVDNVKVEAAPCELQAPSFKFNIPGGSQPIGARYFVNESIILRARDPKTQGITSGVDSVVLFYNKNNTGWQNLNMTAVNAIACPDSSNYSYTFTGLNVGDTIDWYLEIFDCTSCMNKTRVPGLSTNPNFYTFWRNPSPPLVCGTTLPNSFPNVITTFPWTETFDNISWLAGSGVGATGTTHRGIFPVGNPPAGRNWTVNPLQNQTGFAWSIRNGPTGTFNTGPAGDNTTGNGKYLYTEASQGTSGASTALITPCLKLSGMQNVALQFYYHMFGANMGNLIVDVDTNSSLTNANPDWVLGVFTLTGAQQTASTAPWKKAVVNLTAYKNRNIRIRFRGTKAGSAAQDLGDISIDDLKIYEPNPVEMEVLAFNKPQNGFCSYTNQEVVRIQVRNNGFSPILRIPVGFVVRQGTNPPVVFRDTINKTLNLGDTAFYNFVPKANLSAYATYTLKVFVDAANDNKVDNDTIGPRTIDHFAPLATFPHRLTFEGAGWNPGNGTALNPGTFGTTEWSSIPASNSGEYAFMVESGLTTTASTGPRFGFGRAGNYLYSEASFGSNSPTALWQSTRCINLGGMPNATLEFWYHMNGADINSVGLQVVDVNSNVWTNVPNSALSVAPAQHTDATQDWKFFSVNLSAYNNKVVKLRLTTKKNNAGVLADIAFDNFTIYNRAANDVGVAQVSTPANSTAIQTPTVAPVLVLRNYGTSAATNIPVSYVVRDLCTPANTATYTATFAGPIPAGGTANFTLPVGPTYYSGDFQLKAWTTLVGDAYAFNDTAKRITAGTTEFNIPFGPINFEGCAGDQMGFFAQANGITVGPTNTAATSMQMWEFGTPQKGGAFTGAASGTNAWVTGLKENYHPARNEVLRVPTLKNFDTIVGAELRFKQFFDFAAGDGGCVEFFNNNTWNLLGNSSVNVGVNWYGSQYGVPALTSLNGPGWSGTTGNQWISSSIPLNIWNGNTNPLRLRFRMATGASGTGKGWAIDDFELYVPPQNSAAPIVVDTREYLIIPGDTSHIKVRLQNTGAKKLDSCRVRYQVNGGAWSSYETVAFTPPLLRGATRWFEFDQVWVNSGAGTYNICVETSRPNNKQDNLTTDDLLCRSFTTLDEVAITATSGYCNDFENPATPAWLGLHYKNKDLPHDWEFGTPNKTVINTASNGTKAWITKLSGPYDNMTQSALHTPFFLLDSNKVYTMEFKHHMYSELYHDGGSVDWSYDGGITWYTLGNVLVNGRWYNTAHVTSLDLVRPGWSGETGGWDSAQIRFTAENAGKLIFRFRYGSDYTLEKEGWAIDEFCLNEAPAGTPADIIGIGREEYDAPGVFTGEIVPNPARDEATLSFNTSTGGAVKIRVTNLQGQVLAEEDLSADVGLNLFRFNTSLWSSGMYVITVDYGGQQVTRRFVVQH